MANLKRSISSLGALATFEAAARHGNFTVAASELGVTQAAVSRQIKLLETELNTLLFLRAHRRVILTPDGMMLSATLTNSFANVAEVIDTIRQPLTENCVTLGATLAFTHFWLLPRLSDFRSKYPETKLKLVADDGPADLRHDRLDLVVRYGLRPQDGAVRVASQPDEVFPVCSPKLLARFRAERDTVDLLSLPLIASDWLDPAWLTWKAWAKSAGLPPALGKASDSSRLRFNHYTDTVQAAINGEGVALGWAMLLSTQLQEGRLVRIGDRSVIPEERYNVLVPNGREPSRPVMDFLDWMKGEFSGNP